MDRISLSDSFAFMRKNEVFLYLAVIWGALLGIETILSAHLAQYVSIYPRHAIDTDGVVPQILLFIAILIIFYFIFLFFHIYVIRFTANSIMKRKEDYISVILKNMLGVIAIGIVILILYAVILIFAAIPIFLSPAFACLTIPIALIVLFFVAVRLSFAVYPYIIHDTGIVESIYRSWEITDGRVLEVFVFVLISYLPALLFSIISSAIPDTYFYISVVFDFITAYFFILALVNLTRGYMELSHESRAKTNAFSTPAEGLKPIFAFGMSDYELSRLREAGLYVIPVSFRAQQARVADMIGYADFYAGDSTWYPRKVIFMHGTGDSEMKWLMDVVRYYLGPEIIFGRSNIKNTDMSVSQVLDALVREHDAQKPLNP